MTGTSADVTNWLNAMPGGITFPVVHSSNWSGTTDWSIANLYVSGGISWPYTVLIDVDGIIQQIDSGTLFTEAQLEEAILEVVYKRDPVDLELVVDVSDSMNTTPSSAPSGDSKLLLLKQAANIVVDVLTEHAQANDRMGLVRFTDDVSEFSLGGVKLLPLGANEASLRGQIDTLTTGMYTAMGAGLQTAFDTLTSQGTQKRFAILCTDGMQNIQPKVTPVDGHFEIIDSDGWVAGAHASVPPHPGVDIASYNTHVHTIGIGATSEWEPALQGVADQTGGFYRSTTDPQTDLALIYAVDLCSCLAHGSPAVVRHASGALDANGEATEGFYLNRSARKVTVAVFWPASEHGSLMFWLHGPDGTLIPLYDAMKLHPDRSVATLLLPVDVDGRTVNHVGYWTVDVRGEAGVAGPVEFQLLVIAEDRETKCIINYPRKTYAVGDVVPLHLRMSNSEAEHRFVDVALETIRPVIPVAEALHRVPKSRVKVKQSKTAHRDVRAHISEKLRSMAADPEWRDLLRTERTQSSLRGGTLECAAAAHEVTVPLRLTQPGVTSYRIETLCETADGGPVARMTYVSVFAKPGQASQKLSGVGVARQKTKLVLTVTPRNKLGHLFGPGLGGEIEVTTKGEPTKAVVHDLLDGSYEVEIPLRAVGPKTSLLVGGQTLWAGAA
ncbi:MAG TPA: VWA domain-containing protein [Thermoanaerobaculia bacterium]|nr:VWA domain-containing protein [Thermoanaerobaculia bacterium]